MKNLLTLREAAEALGLQKSTVYKWTQLRKIEFVKLSPRAVRIPAEEVERIIKSRTVRSLTEV